MNTAAENLDFETAITLREKIKKLEKKNHKQRKKNYIKTVKEKIKKGRKIEIKTRGLVNQVFSGEYHSVFKGRGMEFSEVREYQIGDDIRNIDWNVTARMGHPFVKVFEEELEMTVMLLVDVSSSGSFGTYERMKGEFAIEICALVALFSFRNTPSLQVNN